MFICPLIPGATRRPGRPPRGALHVSTPRPGSSSRALDEAAPRPLSPAPWQRRVARPATLLPCYLCAEPAAPILSGVRRWRFQARELAPHGIDNPVRVVPLMERTLPGKKPLLPTDLARPAMTMQSALVGTRGRDRASTVRPPQPAAHACFRFLLTFAPPCRCQNGCAQSWWLAAETGRRAAEQRTTTSRTNSKDERRRHPAASPLPAVPP